LKNYTLFLEYLGTRYHGWQKQICYKKSEITIQNVVEKCLSKIANHNVKTTCSGRTDKGVHASAQTASFFTEKRRNCHTWKIGLNALLPRDIRVIKVFEVKKEFNARFSALYRRYNYLIYQNKINSSFFHNHHMWMPYKLNIKSMNIACKYLLGEKDFSSFCSSQCSFISKRRKIHHIYFVQYKKFIVFDIQANAFLHNMVRNIVGELINIGLENKKGEDIASILKLKKAGCIEKIAPAQGLYLIGTSYPKCFNATLINKVKIVMNCR